MRDKKLVRRLNVNFVGFGIANRCEGSNALYDP